MKLSTVIKASRSMIAVLALFFAAAFVDGQTVVPDSAPPPPQTQSAADALKVIDQLVQQNKDLEQQNKKLMEQIDVLRQVLAAQNPAAPAPAAKPPETAAPEQAKKTEKTVRPPTEAVSDDEALEAAGELAASRKGKGSEAAVPKEEKTWGEYSPGTGFQVANTKYGDLRISLMTYFRYLNQLDLAPTYTSSFGTTSNVQQRQDFQINKVQLKFLGWILNPRLRYFFYVWTQNASMGATTPGSTPVAVEGYINYSFSKHATLSLGFNGLPAVRTLEGNFPYWLSVDSRMIADEFFRPSYTTGLMMKGEITPKLRYMSMLGNNMNQIGVPASQLVGKPNTTANALFWMPSTGEFGAGYGDFEDHKKLATRLGTHFSFSNEDRQSQPNTESIENTQIRLTDGTIVFNPNVFGPGILVNSVNYTMWDLDGGIKKHGYSLEGEYYQRWLTDFRSSTGPLNLPTYFARGFQMQASMMLKPKTFQVYAGGSKIFGPNGDPWDSKIGANWYPWKNRVLWWNNEMLWLSRSPVGYNSVPFAFGGKGWVYYSSFVLAFK